MEFLKQWSFCVCITLMISVIFSIISPNGEMKRFYKIMISVFIFISLIYPLKDFDSNDFRMDYDFNIIEVNDMSGKSYENEINRSIKEFLRNKGITANVSSKVNYDINNSEITVENVVISIPDEFSKNDVKNLVYDEMGINSKVIYIGE